MKKYKTNKPVIRWWNAWANYYIIIS